MGSSPFNTGFKWFENGFHDLSTRVSAGLNMGFTPFQHGFQLISTRSAQPWQWIHSPPTDWPGATPGPSTAPAVAVKVEVESKVGKRLIICYK